MNALSNGTLPPFSICTCKPKTRLPIVAPQVTSKIMKYSNSRMPNMNGSTSQAPYVRKKEDPVKAAVAVITTQIIPAGIPTIMQSMM